jgi:tetratricopeptide (TPR) repeat protein
VGASIRRLQEFEARARLAELAVRIPERREQAVKELEALSGQPKEDTAVTHRALAWVHLQRHEYDETFEELSNAADLDRADPWTRYYLALAKYDQAANTGNPIQGLPNMMQDLRTVLDWNPDFAEAYNMLAMAQLQGGGTHAAADSMRPAILLNPRSQTYLLNMAKIYLEGKQWGDATALLNRLKDSPDSEIASAAEQHLEDLPMLKKYGVAPQKQKENAASQPAVVSNNTDEDASNGDQAEPAPAATGPDLRRTQFLRGKLLSVDCSQAPIAVLRLSNATKIVELRTDDYRALLVIGAGAFSCDWRNIPVEVNYKAGGRADGDLVSLEIR